MVPRGAVPDKTWTKTFLPSAFPHAEEADTVSASSAWAHICLLLDFILLECVTWSCRVFRGSTTQQTLMEPLQSSSATGRPQIIAVRIVFLAPTWSPYFGPKNGTLAAHVNKPGSKTGTKNAPKSKPWKSTTLRAMFENQPHKHQKPCPFVLWWFHAARCLTRLERRLSCLLLSHTQKRRILWQNGAKLRPQNKVRNLEHQAMRGNKSFWKTHADGHRITLRVLSLVGACGDWEPIYRMTMTMLDALPKMRHQNRKVEVDQKTILSLSDQKNQL